ncbi:MAG TPA: L-threonylcarbamoyladenylate synthase [Bacteroidia bacterium]|nr:L-threonylcarbamoyladenylate synthase [Bacteroidia bacterium]
MKNKSFDSDIENAVRVLKGGGTILYPTDTIWGIGCDATNASAVEKVFAIKKRAEQKSLIILLDDVEKLYDYVEQIPEHAFTLIEYSRNPLTIIYPKAVNLAANIPAEDGSIAIRITKDEFCRELIRNSGKPLVSSSANVSGAPPPKNFSEISDEIKNAVDYIVQYRQKENKISKPSTIIRLGMKGEIEFIRK